MQVISVNERELSQWMLGYKAYACQCGRRLLAPHRVRTGMLAARCPQCVKRVYVEVEQRQEVVR